MTIGKSPDEAYRESLARLGEHTSGIIEPFLKREAHLVSALKAIRDLEFNEGKNAAIACMVQKDIATAALKTLVDVK